MNAFSTIAEILVLLRAKKISAQEVLNFYLARLQKYSSLLNSTINIFEAAKILQKKELSELDILFGVPCLVKDNLCVQNTKTTAASKILNNFLPVYNASVVDRVIASGGLVLGKSNMDEFAMGGSGEFSAFGPAKNPWNLSCSPGGSSSGIASAVAAGLVPWGIGSETGGSIRQPAAFCGLVGLFPTYGLLPRYGLLPFGSSLDQPGPIARTVQDAAIALTALAGYDNRDSTSANIEKKDYRECLNQEFPRGLKIGVIADSFSESVDPEIKEATVRAVAKFESLGAVVKNVEIASLKYGISVYFILSRAEAASNLARIDGALYGQRPSLDIELEKMYDQTRSLGFGGEVKRRILLGNYVLSSEHRDIYQKANVVRSMIQTELDAAFEEFDLLISPTTPMLPFELGSKVNDPLAMYLCDYFYLPNCVAGFPAISFPAGFSSSKLPIGVQLIGARFKEDLLIQVAHCFEKNSEFTNLHPAGFD